jgi:transcriptional regulator with XRE-family HTH domain
MQDKSFAFERKAAYLSVAMASEKAGPYWTAAAARIRQRLSGDRGGQKVLASQIGVSEATLSRFLDVREEVRTEPSLDQAARIAEALGWSPQELLGDPKTKRALLESPELPEGDLLRELSEVLERHGGAPRRRKKPRAASR